MVERRTIRAHGVAQLVGLRPSIHDLRSEVSYDERPAVAKRERHAGKALRRCRCPKEVSKEARPDDQPPVFADDSRPVVRATLDALEYQRDGAGIARTSHGKIAEMVYGRNRGRCGVHRHLQESM